MDEAGALADPQQTHQDRGDAKDEQGCPHQSQPLATDPPGDVERDLVGGAIEGGADRRRGAVSRGTGGEAASATPVAPAAASEAS